MSFVLKEAFPVRKLLPFTANAPPIAMLVAGEDILVNSSMTFASAFNIALAGWGGGS